MGIIKWGNTMWAVIGSISLVASIALLIVGIVAKVRKKGNVKKFLFTSLGLFVLFIVAVASSPTKQTEALQVSPSASAVSSKSTNDPKVDEQKKKSDEAAKAMAKLKEQQQAEIKAKAEEEAKLKAEKSFDGNGTFAVNKEVKPGLYRVEDGISYWARTSGFSGELGEIIANGSPSGPAIVDIKSTDVGFQTMGSGTWTRIDDSYNPEVLTEFGDGTYIVGKEIMPGTYKSDGSVNYWARLKNFTGDMNSISANGAPTGPEIVQIKSTDKGFVTSGGGTWKKVK
jgi:hypothetical protein